MSTVTPDEDDDNSSRDKTIGIKDRSYPAVGVERFRCTKLTPSRNLKLSQTTAVDPCYQLSSYSGVFESNS